MRGKSTEHENNSETENDEKAKDCLEHLKSVQSFPLQENRPLLSYPGQSNNYN